MLAALSRSPFTGDKDLATAYIARPRADYPVLAIRFQREYAVTTGPFLSWINRQSHPAVTRLWRRVSWHLASPTTG